MPLYFERLTASDLKSLSPAQTVFFFPVGPLEDHGPHLPMGTHLFEALHFAVSAAERLEKEQPGWTAVIMPAAPLGINSHTTRLSLTVRPHVLRDWLVDACHGLWKADFRYFVCFSGERGPRQLTAIEDAAKFLRRKAGRLRSSPILRRWSRLPILVSATSAQISAQDVWKSPFWPDPLEHAGMRDTSVMLAIVPDLVRPVYKTLPSSLRPDSRWDRLWQRLRQKTSGYWGSPQDADPEIGKRILDRELDGVFVKLRAVWDGANPESLFRSWYSILPPNRSLFKAWLLAIALLILVIVWIKLLLQSTG